MRENAVYCSSRHEFLAHIFNIVILFRIFANLYCSGTSKKKGDDDVNSVSQYFSVYVYVEFQIGSNTANLHFSGTFPKS